VIGDRELWHEVSQARLKAHEKHGANSIEALDPLDPKWLAILGEEAGEVAEVLVDQFAGVILAKSVGRVNHALTYDANASLRAELIDVLSVATAWVEALDRRA
jgi:hypothetical protein